MNARHPNVGLNNKEEGARRDRAHPSPSSDAPVPAPADEAGARASERAAVSPAPGRAGPGGAGPLTEEQVAYYRSRIESGFYQDPEIRRQIAERLADDVFPSTRR